MIERLPPLEGDPERVPQQFVGRVPPHAPDEEAEHDPGVTIEQESEAPRIVEGLPHDVSVGGPDLFHCVLFPAHRCPVRAGVGNGQAETASDSFWSSAIPSSMPWHSTSMSGAAS